MNFYDTSIFVAALLRSHASHAMCSQRIADADKSNAACGLHSLGELYSTLTRLPRPQKVPPAQAAALVRLVSTRTKCVSLSLEERMHIFGDAAAQGLSGPIIYDAMLMECARKAGAMRIYTLNPAHFKLVARDLASIVHLP